MTPTTTHILKGPTSQPTMILIEGGVKNIHSYTHTLSGTHLTPQVAGGPVTLERDHPASFNQALQGHSEGSSIVSVFQQDDFPF